MASSRLCFRASADFKKAAMCCDGRRRSTSECTLCSPARRNDWASSAAWLLSTWSSSTWSLSTWSLSTWPSPAWPCSEAVNLSSSGTIFPGGGLAGAVAVATVPAVVGFWLSTFSSSPESPNSCRLVGATAPLPRLPFCSGILRPNPPPFIVSQTRPAPLRSAVGPFFGWRAQVAAAAARPHLSTYGRCSHHGVGQAR